MKSNTQQNQTQKEIAILNGLNSIFTIIRNTLLLSQAYSLINNIVICFDLVRKIVFVLNINNTLQIILMIKDFKLLYFAFE